jgi:hypothetical protein
VAGQPLKPRNRCNLQPHHLILLYRIKSTDRLFNHASPLYICGFSGCAVTIMYQQGLSLQPIVMRCGFSGCKPH